MYRPFLGGKCSGKFIICTKICGNKPIRMFHWPLLFTCLDRGLCFSINSSPFHHWCTTGGHRTNLWRWTFPPSCRLRLLCTLHNPYLCGPVWGPGIAWQSSQLDGLTSWQPHESWLRQVLRQTPIRIQWTVMDLSQMGRYLASRAACGCIGRGCRTGSSAA